MNLLESFYFIFDADMGGVQKKLKESDKLTMDFTKSLEAADKTTQKVGAAFVDLAKKGAAAFSVIAAAGVIKRMTMETADHTFEVRQQALALTESTERLTAWQHAVIASGGTAKGATDALTGLRDKFIEIARMGGGMGPDGFMLTKLGLSREDMQKGITDPTQALDKLADTFHKLNAVQQQFVGKRLGFDQGTIALLSQGSKALNEMLAKQKELGVVTEKQVEVAAKFKLAQAQLGLTFETVKREITTELLPPLTWLYEHVEKFVQFLREHKTMTEAFFIGLAAVLVDAVVPALISVGIAALPIIGLPLLIGAAVAGVALLADDLYAFMNGQNSLLGELAKKWPWLGNIIRTEVNAIISGIKLVNAVLGDTFQYLIAFGKFFTDALTVGPAKALANFGETSRKLGKDLMDHVQDAGSAINNAARGGPSAGAARGVPADVVAAAKAAQGKYGIPAAVTMAQWALESGNGAHMPAGSNNPFGIKARAGQPYVDAMTTEHINGRDVQVSQRFAKFDSIADAFEAHAKLLATGGAYANARANENDPNKFADALTGKYATDPQYGAKLRAIIAQQAVYAGVSAAQAALATSTAPIFTQGAGTINNSGNKFGTKHINVGPVNVHTQATDANGISKDMGKSLDQHLNGATTYFDDSEMG